MININPVNTTWLKSIGYAYAIQITKLVHKLKNYKIHRAEGEIEVKEDAQHWVIDNSFSHCFSYEHLKKMSFKTCFIESIEFGYKCY